MVPIIVADAGPLIALARVDRLQLFRDLYPQADGNQLVIPTAVRLELGLSEHRPGSDLLRRAMTEEWITTVEVADDPELTALMNFLDAGEAEAIFLAEKNQARFLLIDERRGRQVAQRRNIPVVGTGGLLLAAKQKGLISHIQPILESMSQNRYRFSARVYASFLRAAGELKPE